MQKNKTRAEWNKFYENGTIDVDPGEGAVFTKGALLRGIGYWNLMYDKLGSEGYDYAADAGGYTSNVINAHAAYSILNNDDFDPASRYATLTIGYSGMFGALFVAIVDLAATTGVKFDYLSNTRLHSILVKRGKGIEYAYATRQDPLAPRWASSNGCGLVGDASLLRRTGGPGQPLRQGGRRGHRRAQPHQGQVVPRVGHHAAVVQDRHVLRFTVVVRDRSTPAPVPGATDRVRCHQGRSGRADRRGFPKAVLRSFVQIERVQLSVPVHDGLRQRCRSHCSKPAQRRGRSAAVELRDPQHHGAQHQRHAHTDGRVFWG